MPIYEVEVPLLAPAPDAEPTEESVGLTPPGQITRPAPAEWLRSYIEPEPVHCPGARHRSAAATALLLGGSGECAEQRECIRARRSGLGVVDDELLPGRGSYIESVHA